MNFVTVTRMSDALSANFLENYGLLPIEMNRGELVIGTWLEAVNETAVDELALLFRAAPRLVRHPEADVRAAIRRVYGKEVLTAEQVIADLDTDDPVNVAADAPIDDLRSMANEAPVIRLVNLLILEALEARASDVHLQSHAEGVLVRYRIDGVLQQTASPPANMAAAVVSRLKIMAELDIAERRLPQDGRLRLRLQKREVDVRVSTLPTLHGESVVLRLLDKERSRATLDDLGMAIETLRDFRRVIAKPNGIILVTGPTGSGKTTTLYGALDCIRTGREKILTVEDPVEYQLAGVTQVQINPKIGLTLAAALRALLRQDPDVLLVGEIRDRETAEIATHAAMTGHLVLSTLHTNDAVGALIRLIELGVPDYLVASTVEAVLAQRLVRQVCDHCAEQHPVAENQWRALGGTGAAPMIRRGDGCQECRGTGFRGRTGIYELLLVESHVRSQLLQRPDAAELRRVATLRGLRALREDGVRQIAGGITTPEEVLRVTV